MNADSLIGVSSTRPGNLWYRPLVTPEHAAPGVVLAAGAPVPPTTSSPNRTTVGSRAISCASASLIACWKVIVRAIVAPSVLDVDVGQQVGGRRVRARPWPRRRRRRSAPRPRRRSRRSSSALDHRRPTVTRLREARPGSRGCGAAPRPRPGRGRSAGRPRSGRSTALTLHSSSVGPPPARARAIASPAASWTAKKSRPSTTTPGMPKPSARLATSTPGLVEAVAGRLGVAVVLDHEDARQVPDARPGSGSPGTCPGWSRRRR